jgi:hypothetical protein
MTIFFCPLSDSLEKKVSREVGREKGSSGLPIILNLSFMASHIMCGQFPLNTYWFRFRIRSDLLCYFYSFYKHSNPNALPHFCRYYFPLNYLTFEPYFEKKSGRKMMEKKMVEKMAANNKQNKDFFRHNIWREEGVAQGY